MFQIESNILSVMRIDNKPQFSCSLDKAKLRHDSPDYDFNAINFECNKRIHTTKKLNHAILTVNRGLVRHANVFSLDGSLRIQKGFFEKTAPEFFTKSRRAILFGELYYLRGSRFNISANPTFEMRQKLDSLIEDFEEGMAVLPIELNGAYQLGMADYIKNSVVTLFNSYVYGEKTGNYHFSDKIYQDLRADGAALVEAAVQLYYGHYTGNNDISRQGYLSLKKGALTLKRLENSILKSYEDGIFSSRHMTRSEASHPGINLAAATYYASSNKISPQIIVGLPAGSTELAYVHKVVQKKMRNVDSEVLLFPVSLHSIKTDFDGVSPSRNQRINFISSHRKKFLKKNVLIVDDNSSTGNTLNEVFHAINYLKKNKPLTVSVSIAEADTTRSMLDLKKTSRPKIANRLLYHNSVNVLPVSIKVQPKTDLREIFENRRTIACIRQRYLSSGNDLKRKIIGRIYIDLIRNKTRDILENMPSENITDNFRKTFLSNFSTVDIIYSQRKFISVEHAYQAMKFHAGSLEKVTSHDVGEINKEIEGRGIVVTKEMLPHIFTIDKIEAGTSKKIANKLRRLGYVRNDWDSAKIVIMIELLILKFSDDKYYNLLQKTKGQYLVEGNDWGDTYWGSVEGRGRNILGRALMEIRRLDHAIIRDAAKYIILDNA